MIVGDFYECYKIILILDIIILIPKPFDMKYNEMIPLYLEFSMVYYVNGGTKK